MRVSNAVRHIEHLASLRFAPHVAIPEMLRALDGILPDAQPGFFWVDGDGSVLDTYLPAPQPRSIPARVDPRMRAGALFQYRDDGGFQMTLRVGGTVRAILSMRRPHAACFTERERRILATLAPCFAQALQAVPIGAAVVFDDVADRNGILVATADGRLVSADADALQLLLEMTDAPLTPDLPRFGCDSTLPAFLIDLMRRQTPGSPTAPRILQKTARWGAYRMRAFRQAPAFADSAEGVTHAVLVSRHLPRTVRLMRTIAACDLSPRERQAAFQLGIGADAAAASAALGVSIMTWRSYVKRVYQRLDVRDRVELMSRLGVALVACA